MYKHTRNDNWFQSYQEYKKKSEDLEKELNRYKQIEYSVVFKFHQVIGNPKFLEGFNELFTQYTTTQKQLEIKINNLKDSEKRTQDLELIVNSLTEEVKNLKQQLNEVKISSNHGQFIIGNKFDIHTLIQKYIILRDNDMSTVLQEFEEMNLDILQVSLIVDSINKHFFLHLKAYLEKNQLEQKTDTFVDLFVADLAKSNKTEYPDKMKNVVLDYLSKCIEFYRFMEQCDPSLEFFSSEVGCAFDPTIHELEGKRKPVQNAIVTAIQALGIRNQKEVVIKMLVQVKKQN